MHANAVEKAKWYRIAARAGFAVCVVTLRQTIGLRRGFLDCWTVGTPMLWWRFHRSSDGWSNRIVGQPCGWCCDVQDRRSVNGARNEAMSQPRYPFFIVLERNYSFIRIFISLWRREDCGLMENGITPMGRCRRIFWCRSSKRSSSQGWRSYLKRAP